MSDLFNWWENIPKKAVKYGLGIYVLAIIFQAIVVAPVLMICIINYLISDIKNSYEKDKKEIEKNEEKN